MKALAALFAPVCLYAQASALSGSFLLPLEDDAIQYQTVTHADPVAKLQQRIDRGEAKLDFRSPNGFLLSVLRELNVPVSSQTLVFSKTSFQQSLISPSAPRAVYFNDDVYVGWVKHSDVLELSAVDPLKGGVFYTLDQRDNGKPRFTRHDECLQCHASPRTLGVPGHLVRSVFPDREGFPQLNGGAFHTDHSSPFSERFGGWYVTGSHGSMRHMGNSFVENKDEPDKIDRDKGANKLKLDEFADLSLYPSRNADIAAHMVLSHQATGHNLLTRVSYEARVAVSQQEGINRALGRPLNEWSDSTRRRIYGTAEVLVKYLLMTGEAKLAEPVAGNTSFAKEFAAGGRRDSRNRSLKDLDLKTRLFRYPCSFLIYTDAFLHLPKPAKDYVDRRLLEVLTGKDRSKEFASLTDADRKAILEILRETRTDLPDSWRTADSGN